MEARYYTKNRSSTVTCNLCPQNCTISTGARGKCGVRINDDGILRSMVYGVASALSTDPVEKKPLYHFHPGKNILSLGSFGCNLSCNFCQNHHISQVSGINIEKSGRHILPEELVIMARQADNNIGIAFTYNEPVVWYEYMIDTATLIKNAGMRTIVVSNGYINRQPLLDLLPFADAFNIDLKSFDNDFYRKQSGAKLQPVLDSLKLIASSGKHLEITMLIIPGLNDNEGAFRNMVNWIADNCGTDTVLHLSRYFPNYKSNRLPTPDKTLTLLYSVAREVLHFTYIGNTTSGTAKNTFCPGCGSLLIERSGYTTSLKNLDKRGNCSVCNRKIIENITF